MSKKSQTPIFDPQGSPFAEVTTFSHDFLDGYEIEDHFHHEGQILFASRGVMTVRTPHGIWVVPPLRAVWIPGDEVHSIVMSGAVLMRTLYFSPKISKSISKKCFVLDVSPLFRELILHACNKPAWKVRIAKEKRLIEMLLDQMVAANQLPVKLPHPVDPRAARVVDILVTDPSDRRTLTQLCKKTGGSKRTIERAFLNETGMTFGKWRQQLRLLHSMKLLASGEKVITAAMESGYNSPSAFISVFKKTLGHTPNQYMGKSELDF